MPTDRAIAFGLLDRAAQWRVLRQLAHDEGLDGMAAAAAMGHALSDNASPWAPAADAAIGAEISQVLAGLARGVLQTTCDALRRATDYRQPCGAR